MRKLLIYVCAVTLLGTATTAHAYDARDDRTYSNVLRILDECAKTYGNDTTSVSKCIDVLTARLLLTARQQKLNDTYNKAVRQ